MTAAEKIDNFAPAIPNKDQQEIQQLVRLPDAYRNMVIKTHTDCQLAVDVLSEAKAKAKALEERRKLITKPLDDAKKSVMDLFRPATDALAQLEKVLKPKIANFHDEQEAARRKAEAEAEERARLERERLEARAEKLREQGKEEKADALEYQAATTVAAAPAHTAPKISGASIRKTWVADVVDPVAVCKAIAEGLLPPTIIEFKQAELNKVASTWQNTREFPGLRIAQKSTVASR